MKIDKVTFQTTYNIGPFLNVKVGFEASVSDGENEFAALTTLKQTADEWHKLEYPHLYQEQSGVPFVKTPIENFISHPQHVPPPIEINLQHERISIAIENSTTVSDLQKVKEKNPLLTPKLIECWNLKMAELTK